MKRSGEVDVDAIFRIDELLDTEEDDDVPPERAAWYDEYEEGEEPPSGS
jgi:hypothetical protein